MPPVNPRDAIAALRDAASQNDKTQPLIRWMDARREKVQAALTRADAVRIQHQADFRRVDLRAIVFRNAIVSPTTASTPSVAVLPDPYGVERVPDPVAWFRKQVYTEVAAKQETTAAAALRQIDTSKVRDGKKLPTRNQREAEIAAHYVALGRYVQMALEGSNHYRQRTGYETWDTSVDLFYGVDFDADGENLAVLWSLARMPLAVKFAVMGTAMPVSTWVTGFTTAYCAVPNKAVQSMEEFRDAIPASAHYNSTPVAQLLTVHPPRWKRSSEVFIADPGPLTKGRPVVVVPRIAYVPTVGYYLDFEFCTYAICTTAGSKSGPVVFDVEKLPEGFNPTHLKLDTLSLRDYSKLILPEYGPPIDTATGLPVGPELGEVADRYTSRAILIDAPVCTVRTPLTGEFLTPLARRHGTIEPTFIAAGFKESRKPLAETGAKAYHITEYGGVTVRVPAGGKK